MFEGHAQKQAFLAYMFTAGRAFVNQHAAKARETGDVILDRWQVTGWAYQACDGHEWQQIKNLNQSFEILVPDVQLILACPFEEIPQRKLYRSKKGAGTAGQMSAGKEEPIFESLVEIYQNMKSTVPTRLIFNSGKPSPDLETQINQIMPVFEEVSSFVKQHGFKTKLLPEKSF